MFGKMRGFTLIELLVVIAIIAILAAILFPIFVSAQETARATRCAQQARQLALAIVRYGDDHGGYIVKSANPEVNRNNPVLWPTILKPYYKSKNLHICPSRKLNPKYTDHTYSFGIGLNHPNICGFWDAELVKFSQVRRLSKTVVAGDVAYITGTNWNLPPEKWQEEEGTWIFRTPGNWDWGPERLIARHNGKTNAIFLDGHAKALPILDIGFQYPQGHALAMWDIY